MYNRGKFQGYIIGDAGSYATYQNALGVTFGYIDGNKTDNPDYVGSEAGLYELAKAKIYTRTGY